MARAKAYKAGARDEADDGPARARASMDLIRAATGAEQSGLTGAGVDVALIDSGAIGVGALGGAGKLVRGPDFSDDAWDPDRRGLDAFGHGSHMAGVIAGSDAGSGYRGIAPGARLVSVKVADADGRLRAARALLDEEIARMWSAALEGRPLSLVDRARIRTA